MPATVRTLVGAPELALRLIGAGSPGGALDEAVSWVHSSDLADPTPFLDAGQVLLTTGGQFDGGDADVAPYVERLSAAGIRALGFGSGVVRRTVPDALAAACASAGLPLFEVPYSTPFIAVVRFAADSVARDAYARNTWALEAQRAISLAATRPDGLGAILAELSEQLEGWVALYRGAAGERIFPANALDPSAGEIVRVQAMRLLRAGRRSSRVIAVGNEPVTLQTIGVRGRLRGVLAIGDGGRLDAAGHQVVTSVIGLAGLALEQHHALDRARGHLRVGLLQLLLGGDIDLASATAQQMWHGLPKAPVQLGLADVADSASAGIAERLEPTSGTTLFHALDGGRLTLIASAGSPVFAEVAAEFDLTVAVSAPLGYEELVRGRQQAAQVLERPSGPRGRQPAGVIEFGSLAARGMLALLVTADAREVAGTLLGPLLDRDRRDDSRLVESLRAWLVNGAQYEAAARTLGVHRHTLRARIREAELILGRDLSSFPARAEVWAALSALSA